MAKLFWTFDYKQYLPIFTYCEPTPTGKWFCKVLESELSDEEIFDDRVTCIAAALCVLRERHAAVRYEIRKLNYAASAQLKVGTGR